MKASRLGMLVFSLSLLALQAQQKTWNVSGRIVDDTSGDLVEARLYVESHSKEKGSEYYLANSASTEGRAVPYEKKRGIDSIEVHTCLSAHPFQLKLPPGTYTFTAIRGKEYLPAIRKVIVSENTQPIELRIKRWINMAEKGWYSGDTHNHREMGNMNTLLLAEDLNVGLPITAWVAKYEETPKNSSKVKNPISKGELISIGDNYAIWTGNTEYEVGSVAGKRHVFGALFVLNHKTPIDHKTVPVAPIVEHTRSEGGLLELDKHNWPWSMMLVPVAEVDLFELTNNHIWRTKFAFSTFFADYAYGAMEVEKDDQGGFTERGWIDFGFKNYYALLNCGIRIMPTAGTASGVHPVPLGFGRVYVNTGGKKLDYGKWISGLKKGNSFVTTGPMLFSQFSGKPPGSEIKLENPDKLNIKATVRSVNPVNKLEVIINGEVSEIAEKKTTILSDQTVKTEFEFDPLMEESSWVALRIFEHSPDKRPRFAHTAPVFVTIPGLPLKPRRAEVEYLLKRAEDEVSRNRGVISNDALAEFEEAAAFYRALLPASR